MSSPVDKTSLQKRDTAKSSTPTPLEKRKATPLARPSNQVASRPVDEVVPTLEHRNKTIQRSELYTAINESIAAFHLSRAGMSADEERAVFAVLENSVHSRLRGIRSSEVPGNAAEELSTKLTQNLKGLSISSLGELHTLDSHRVYTLVQE